MTVFLAGWSQKMLVFDTVFGMSRKHGRHETLQIAMFWPLLDAETLVFTQFSPVTVPNPEKKIHGFLHLLNRLFALMTAKTLVFTHFSKTEDRDMNETL